MPKPSTLQKGLPLFQIYYIKASTGANNVAVAANAALIFYICNLHLNIISNNITIFADLALVVAL